MILNLESSFYLKCRGYHSKRACSQMTPLWYWSLDRDCKVTSYQPRQKRCLNQTNISTKADYRHGTNRDHRRHLRSSHNESSVARHPRPADPEVTAAMWITENSPHLPPVSHVIELYNYNLKVWTIRNNGLNTGRNNKPPLHYTKRPIWLVTARTFSSHQGHTSPSLTLTSEKMEEDHKDLTLQDVNNCVMNNFQTKVRKVIPDLHKEIYDITEYNQRKTTENIKSAVQIA